MLMSTLSFMHLPFVWRNWASAVIDVKRHDGDYLRQAPVVGAVPCVKHALGTTQRNFIINVTALCPGGVITSRRLLAFRSVHICVYVS